MPDALARACPVFGCGHTTPCPLHARPSRRDRPRHEPEHANAYDLRRWRRVSVLHLKRYPLCGDRPASAPPTTDSWCRRTGRVTAATQTDHIVPHRGDPRLLWAESNRQSLCAACHGAKSRREQVEQRRAGA